MQDKVAEYEKVLRELQSRVSAADQDLIRSTLEKVVHLISSEWDDTDRE